MNIEQARRAVIAVESEDECWQPQDERGVTAEPTEDPARFSFVVAGTFDTVRGCVVFQPEPEVYYHDGDLNTDCPFCGWVA
jgi:hypothetical protein